MLDIEKLVDAFHEYVERAVVPIAEQNAALIKRIEELERREPQKGEPGKDAEPVLVADVVAELVKSDLLAPVLDLYVEERVAKHFDANPVQHGKDGEAGPKGDPGDPGKDGMPGRDGLDVKDLFRADGGHLIAVLSDGTTKDLGQFIGKDGDAGKEGDPGKDGADGLGFDHFEAEYDGERTLIHRYRFGDVVKEFRFKVEVARWSTKCGGR